MAANIVAAAGLVNVRAPNAARCAASSSSEHDSKATFRLSEDSIALLSTEFHQHRQATHLKSSWATSARRVDTFLSYMSSGGYFRQVGRSGGMATSTAHLHVREVVEFVYGTAAQHIRLPSPEELNDLSFGAINGRRVVLLLDGFVMKIQRPAGANEAYFCGRSGKHYDGLNIQYVVDKNGHVRHIVAGISGRSIFIIVGITLCMHVCLPLHNWHFAHCRSIARQKCN